MTEHSNSAPNSCSSVAVNSAPIDDVEKQPQHAAWVLLSVAGG